jgi:TorA maturation chaperone TorD
VELNFMKLLAEREKETRETEDGEEAGKAMEIQREFLENHLGRWAPLFCGKVIRFASMPFYAEFARLTDAFIQNDLKELGAVSNLTPGSGKQIK